MKYTLSLADVPTNTATCGLVNLALDRRDLRSAALPALLRAVIFPHLFGVRFRHACREPGLKLLAIIGNALSEIIELGSRRLPVPRSTNRLRLEPIREVSRIASGYQKCCNVALGRGWEVVRIQTVKLRRAAINAPRRALPQVMNPRRLGLGGA